MERTIVPLPAAQILKEKQKELAASAILRYGLLIIG